jgi:hypothetical protein
MKPYANRNRSKLEYPHDKFVAYHSREYGLLLAELIFFFSSCK